jgi:hypothetical protein
MPQSLAMLPAADRRAHKRHQVHLRATIDLTDGRLIDGTVCDLSEGGARIRLQGEIGLPERFEITIGGQPHVYRALLCWSKGGDLGVAFEFEDDE